MEKLKVKAQIAYDACLHSDASAGLESELQLGTKTEQNDELDLIGGRVKIISSKKNLSSSGSSPDVQAEKANVAHSFHRPAVDMTGLNVNQLSVNPSPISPASSSVTSPVHLQNLSAVRSEKGGDIGMGPNNYQPYTDMGNFREGSYTAGRDYPQTVKLDEWVPPNASRNPGASYSQSSHPQQGLDGLEYGHPNHATIGEQRGYTPYDSHTARLPDDYPVDPYGRPFTPNSAAEVQASGHAYYRAGEHEYFTSAPREFSEMGLASQHSGLNQRWTHFMQDSGVFYNQHGQAM